MAHDIVIRGGDLIDGSGAEPVPGDLAIDGDVISAVGQVSGKGRREIDAQGLAVTPGFVDLHTHLDAQIGWDPQMTPVSWHGVTTALLGNCGVTFAPCKPDDVELLGGDDGDRRGHPQERHSHRPAVGLGRLRRLSWTPSSALGRH